MCNKYYLGTIVIVVTCSGCKQSKPRDEFIKDASRTNGLTSWCKVCTRGRRKGVLPVGSLSENRALAREGKRRCSRCREIKPLEEYHRNRAGRDGRQNNCKVCHRQYLRERRAAEPDRTSDLDHAARRRRQKEDPEGYAAVRLAGRLKKHHLSVERYNEMMVEQGGKCLICDAEFSGLIAAPNIDHDHSCCSGGYSCGKCVRSLLCSSCNRGLGLFRDDPSLLLNAAAYLKSRAAVGV